MYGNVPLWGDYTVWVEEDALSVSLGADSSPFGGGGTAKP